ncbi:MAG: hypothetical protein KGN33_18365 [Paracoccaceae bacterium]|nr:hypothetical protein [Paracoccaceae bacterium]
MELKEFIEETISAIADATMDLQAKYAEDGVVVNPPTDGRGNEAFEEGGASYTYRRVQNVAFDVALTVSSEKKGQAGGRIKILAAEVGANGSANASSEQVSRVQFSVPVSLTPSSLEATHKEKAQQTAERQKKKLGMSSGRTAHGGQNSWMGS